jgi:gag-polypeptide of LTR copia-type
MSTTSVTVITLSQTDLEKIEILDRSQNNWGVWSDKLQNYLLLKHGGGYLLGIIAHQNPVSDPSGAATWDLNNLCVIAALHTRSSSEEQEFLRPFTNTFLAWSALKACHKKVGPIAQILLIQQALTIRYRRSERLSSTSTQISDLVRRIYVIGLPKEDDFLTIMMLNAMTDNLPHVRNHIADALSTSTSTTIYRPSNIHSRLDVKQQLINTKKLKGPGDLAMVTSSKGNRRDALPGKTYSECNVAGHSFCCTTCGSWGHLVKDCFSKGGAMEGKRDKVLARKCAAHDSGCKGGILHRQGACQDCRYGETWWFALRPGWTCLSP